MATGTNQALESPRGLIAGKDGTRDPIFLFQYRRWVCSPAIDWSDFEYKLGEEGEVYDKDGNEVSNEQLAADEIYVETWITEYVFATREAANAYGEGRSYNFPDGWRSYSVCAEGELAEMLVTYWGRDFRTALDDLVNASKCYCFDGARCAHCKAKDLL